jgi:multiple sugar transport system permease protein
VPYLFVLPQVTATAIFLLHPVAEAARLSLHRWILSLGRPAEFAGMANYVALAEDRLFRQALANTAVYVAGTVPTTLVLGLGLAVALNRPLGRWRSVFRSACYVPVVVPTVVVALVWRFMLDPRAGVVNAALDRLGLPQPAWFADPRFAMLAVVLASVWQQAGFVMVIYLAGLQGIPRQLHDAAAVDGAGVFARFRDVTLPLLAPTTLFVVVIGIVNGFKVFDQVYVMTGGGPANATLTIVQYLYVLAFDLFDVGRGAAAAMVLLALLAVLTAVTMRLGRREVELI